MQKRKIKIVLGFAIFVILVSAGFVHMNTNFLYMKNSVKQENNEYDDLGDKLSNNRNSNNILEINKNPDNTQKSIETIEIQDESTDIITSTDQEASPSSDISSDSNEPNEGFILRKDISNPDNNLQSDDLHDSPQNPPQPLQVFTSVDPIVPYNQYASPQSITATGPSDLDNVTLHYRWSADNSSWEGGFQQISIFDGFESGSLDTNLWEIYSSTIYKG